MQDPDLHLHGSLPYRGHAIDEYRTYSMTQSSYISHSLTNRRPYIHGAHYQTHGTMQTFRSQSPFAYPTRLKRPGYRPSSPALSLNRSVPSSDPDRGQSSRTASPCSMHTVSGVPNPWHQFSNRSDPLLRYYSPVQRVLSSRVSTPKPTSSLHSGAGSARLSQAQAMFPRAWPDPTALTPPPLFYDYSEGFEEQTHIHRTSLLVITPVSLKAEDDQSEHFEHDHIAELEHPSEKTTEQSHASVVELSSFSPGDNLSRSQSEYWPEPPGPIAGPQDLSAPLPNVSTSAPQMPESTLTKPVNDEKPEGFQFEQANARLPTGLEQNINGEAETEKSGSSAAKDQKSSGNHYIFEHDSSSPAASMYSVQSSVPLENIDGSTAPTSGADTATASPEEPPRTPMCESPPVESSPLEVHGHTSESSKASISIASTRNDYPEIVAPTPERSIASLSNRDRFSKILGLDEALLELDSITALSNRRANKSSYAAISVPKAYARPQENPSTPPTTDQAIAGGSSPDDEHQLTNGLMETFGRLSGSSQKDLVAQNPSSGEALIVVCDSPIPSALEKSPGFEISKATDVRLSHRKTVINGGQRQEPKVVLVNHPSTLAEINISKPTPAAHSEDARPANLNKDLPIMLKPSPSIKAFAPPENARRSDLPFAFTPLIRPSSGTGSGAALDATTSFYVPKLGALDDRGQSPRPESKDRLARTSVSSTPGSRPWNLDTSYPWGAEEPPSLDVILPVARRKSQHSTEKHPKFRLRIHRASSSNASKLTKKHRSSEDTMSSVIASSVDFLKAASPSLKPKPNLSIAPSQSNSSHDIIRASPMHTRFVESFEQPSPTSPTITLLPPSPGHDVRSFFSDDSSQARPKGSLRKRLSDLRARGSRANSVDHVSGYDRGLLNSAFGLSRASGRSSRQSQTTAGITSHASRTRRFHWSVFRRFRAWFSCRERRFRGSGGKNRDKDRANRNISQVLCADV